VTTRVLGVDPGTAVTGYGVLEPAPRRTARLIECGVLRTSPREPLPVRLHAIHEGITELITRHQPTVLAVESVYFGRNVRSTVALAHARGVILLAAQRAGLAVAEFPPATVKKSVVGRGGATKAQVAYMVQRLLHLQAPPDPSDAADGVAIGLTYLLTGAAR